MHCFPLIAQHVPPIIGLLGGSFNPAHNGHLHITQEAMKRLGLKEVWWLVTPHNPLKDKGSLANYASRFKSAQQIVADTKHVKISNLEQQINTQYTMQTLRYLKRRYPRTTFVWLMGADNLAGFHRWENWADILTHFRVLVLDRAPFSHRALRSKAAIRFQRNRLHGKRIASLPVHPTPVWGYVHMQRHPESSTAIRTRMNHT